MIVALYYFNKTEEKSGGFIQALKTYEYLKKTGLNVILVKKECSITTNDLIHKADIHHFVGNRKEYLPLVKHIKLYLRSKVILSTIFWTTPTVQHIVSKNKFNYYNYTTRMYAKRFLKVFNITDLQKVVTYCDLLLPNSPTEGLLYRKYWPVNKHTIICPTPNGVDCFLPNQHKIKKHILFLGVINRRKNLTRLIHAINETDFPLVVCGHAGTSNSDPSYFEHCQNIAGKNIQFIGATEHGSKKWLDCLSKAKVFAMPSACETPSLAALEATQFNSNLAMTAVGSTTEYFGPHAEYCDPRSIKSIKHCIERAWKKDINDTLAQRVKSNYSWNNTATITTLAYKITLDPSKKNWHKYNQNIVDLWYPFKGIY